MLASRLLPIVCDMTCESHVARAIAAVAEAAGGICGLVNNAGIHLMNESASLPTSEFEKVFPRMSMASSSLVARRTRTWCGKAAERL